MPGDIRSDGSALPLRHRSSRGQTPRNSGNFTRGSQLFSHEMLIWFSGVKMPFILWGLIFFLAYTVILSLTLNENNVQLICMRVLAWAWEWIGFDQTKAVHGLVGSLLFVTSATMPLAIWFVDYFRQRGSVGTPLNGGCEPKSTHDISGCSAAPTCRWCDPHV